MPLHHLHDRKISAKAQELIDFDMDSIRQVVAAEHRRPPEVWIANPDQYEQNGRVLRDSTSPRLLGYSPEYRVLYTTDGCNSCVHQLSADLQTFSPETIRAFAAESEIQTELLERMVEEIRGQTEGGIRGR